MDIGGFMKRLFLMVCISLSVGAAADDCASKTQKMAAAGVPLNMLNDLAKAGTALNAHSTKVFIADYGRPDSQKRFFEIDLLTGDVSRYVVSDGKVPPGSSDRLSNTPNSHLPPAGLMRIESGRMSPHQGEVFDVHGLEVQNQNLNANGGRGIAVQGCPYVSEESGGHVGQSFGSFCLNPAVFSKIKRDLPGALLYSADPNPNRAAGTKASPILCKYIAAAANLKTTTPASAGDFDPGTS